jgi:hypothetical protein
MAFNTAPVDLSGDIMRDDPPTWMRDYLSFWTANRHLLGDARTEADCAVLHSFETLSFTARYPHESLVLVEQSLLCGGITFDVVFDEALTVSGDIDRYRCLVLANVISLSRQAAERIASYVRAGGALVATEDTALLDENMLPWKGEWLQPRPHHLLAELLGVEWPTEGIVHHRVGRGRVAFVANVLRPWQADAHRTEADQTQAATHLSFASHSYGPKLPMIVKIPALARNHSEILEAVEYALGAARTIVVTSGVNAAPAGRGVVGTSGVGAGPVVVPEVTRNDHGLFVHLLNWNEDEAAADIGVSVRLPGGMQVRSARVLSPDRETPDSEIAFSPRKGRVELSVPRLVCYAVVHVR